MLRAQLEFSFVCPAQDFTRAPIQLRPRGYVVPQGGARDKERALAAELNQVEGRDGAAGGAEEGHEAARAEAVEAL